MFHPTSNEYFETFWAGKKRADDLFIIFFRFCVCFFYTFEGFISVLSHSWRWLRLLPKDDERWTTKLIDNNMTRLKEQSFSYLILMCKEHITKASKKRKNSYVMSLLWDAGINCEATRPADKEPRADRERSCGTKFVWHAKQLILTTQRSKGCTWQVACSSRNEIF